MQHRVGITPARLTFASPAGTSFGWEMRGGLPRLQSVESAVHERRPAEMMGSVAVTFIRTPFLQDKKRRDLRSGTRGNAKFPEPSPIEQNPGAITDGPSS